MDLNLEMPPRGKDVGTLEMALTDFVAEETLDLANRWSCSACNQLVHARKQVTIRLPPAVLVARGAAQALRTLRKDARHMTFATTLNIAPALARCLG